MKARIDWMMVGALLGLIAIGSVAILSAASPLPTYSQIIQKHFLALGLGVLFFLFGLGFNYQIFQDQAKVIYALALALLVVVLLAGVQHKGAKSWLRFGPISFQPSELARVLTILVLGSFLDSRGNKPHRLSTVAGALAISAPVMLLVLAEPDFSSTLPFIPLLITMLFCAGANPIHLVAVTAFGGIAISMPLMWTLLSLRPRWVATSSLAALLFRIKDFNLHLLFTVCAIFLAAYVAWKVLGMARVFLPGPYFAAGALIVAGALCTGVLVNRQLKGYQRNRFVAFLVPEADPKGAAYNVQQAQIAIGSGGLWGKGIFAGTQSQLGFVPERHTDFIYAVIGEEMGFLGSISVVGLYLFLVSRIVHAARVSRDRYGQLVCSGFAGMYAFYMLINIGMCLGFAPVAGVQLPLVSYGGSNLAVTLFAMGIVANVYSRRYAFY